MCWSNLSWVQDNIKFFFFIQQSNQPIHFSIVFQIRLLIVCCLLGRVWNRPFVLVCVLFVRAVEQRRSSLQLLLIIFTHLFICVVRERNSEKNKNCDLALVLICFGPVNTLIYIEKNFVNLISPGPYLIYFIIDFGFPSE